MGYRYDVPRGCLPNLPLIIYLFSSLTHGVFPIFPWPFSLSSLTRNASSVRAFFWPTPVELAKFSPFSTCLFGFCISFSSFFPFGNVMGYKKALRPAVNFPLYSHSGFPPFFPFPDLVFYLCPFVDEGFMTREPQRSPPACFRSFSSGRLLI